MARDVVYGTALAMWNMPWFCKLLTLGLVARILRWWFSDAKGWNAVWSFPFLDTLAAFAASASAELCYVAWQERRREKSRAEGDEPDYDEFN
jgi:hypothetical protein